MRINLSPVRLDEELVVDREGDVLYLNGQEFDFSPLPDGATLPGEAIDSTWFAGPVERIDGELHLTLVLPHGANAPQETRFPEPLTVQDDGPLGLPVHDAAPIPAPEIPVPVIPGQGLGPEAPVDDGSMEDPMNDDLQQDGEANADEQY